MANHPLNISTAKQSKTLEDYFHSFWKCQEVKEKSSEFGLKINDPFGSAKQTRFSNAKCLLLDESAGHSR